MVLRKSFYIRWSAGRSPRVHEVNPGRDPSHVVSAPGVSVDLEKIEAMMSWERPNVNLRDTKFLGIGWISQEIREWAEVVHSGQDYRISPTRYGLHGWNGPDHRERN